MKKNKVIAIIGAGCLCAATAFGAFLYNDAVAYVSVDVNPSIEFGVNRFDQVVDVRGVNEDGSEIIDQIGESNLEHISLDEAIEMTVEEISSEGYFDDTEDAGIIIGTVTEDDAKSEELAGELQESVEAIVENQEAEIQVECEAIGKERVARAKELGVTPGKLNLVEKLQAFAKDGEEFDVEAWLGKPVKDILKAIKQERKALKEEKKKQQQEAATEEATEEGATEDGIAGTETDGLEAEEVADETTTAAEDTAEDAKAEETTDAATKKNENQAPAEVKEKVAAKKQQVLADKEVKKQEIAEKKQQIEANKQEKDQQQEQKKQQQEQKKQQQEQKSETTVETPVAEEVEKPVADSVAPVQEVEAAKEEANTAEAGTAKKEQAQVGKQDTAGTEKAGGSGKGKK